MTFITRIVAATVLTAVFTGLAQAHPHVWVKVTSQVVYSPDGSATGVRHSWEFDDMYSAFALEGLKGDKPGAFTREELAPLAEVNVTSLKETDFFTYAKAGGKDIAFGNAKDYWLDYNKEILTLNFTLPFQSPLKAKDLSVEVYDPSYFVDFSFADKDPVALVGAPAQCKVSLEKPKEAAVKSSPQATSESYFANMNMGANFATKIAVTCP